MTVTVFTEIKVLICDILNSVIYNTWLQEPWMSLTHLDSESSSCSNLGGQSMWKLGWISNLRPKQTLSFGRFKELSAEPEPEIARKKID